MFDIIVNNKTYSLKKKYLAAFVGLFTSVWCEYLNLIAFFSVSLLIFILFLISKEKLKKAPLLFLLIGFYMGFIYFYFISGKFCLNEIGSITNYSIIDGTIENLKNFSDFYKSFAYCVLYYNKYLWVILLGLLVVLKTLSYIPEKYIQTKKKRINLILLLVNCIIIGYLLTCCSSIFIAKQMRGLYIFDHVYSYTIGFHTILFCIFIIIGAIYSLSNKPVKKIILLGILITTASIIYIFIPIYKEDIVKYNKIRIDRYNLEKKIVVYSVFNEPAIIYKNAPPIKYKYFPINTNNLYCVSLIYKHKPQAYIFEDNEDYVNKEFQKRLFLFESVKEDKNIFKIIKFNNLLEYDKQNITLDNIDKLMEKYGQNDILLKTKASLLFDSQEYEKSLSLYKEYAEKNPNDIDAKIKMANIYEIQNKLDLAIDMYDNLLRNDSNNTFLLCKTANLYYKLGNYNKALDIYKTILKDDFIMDYTNSVADIIRTNMSIIYNKIGQQEKAEDCLSKIKNTDNIKNFYKEENAELKDFNMDMTLHYYINY